MAEISPRLIHRHSPSCLWLRKERVLGREEPFIRTIASQHEITWSCVSTPPLSIFVPLLSFFLLVHSFVSFISYSSFLLSFLPIFPFPLCTPPLPLSFLSSLSVVLPLSDSCFQPTSRSLFHFFFSLLLFFCLSLVFLLFLFPQLGHSLILLLFSFLLSFSLIFPDLLFLSLLFSLPLLLFLYFIRSYSFLPLSADP